jgi:putative peptidoglycan lipid II flippase
MNIVKAGATVGGMTMISRVLGFIRDVLIAMALGTGIIADAFFVAFRFPNLFRRLFAEGAFNSAFVPLFSKRLEGEGEAAARVFALDVLAVLLTALLLLTALAEMAMPWAMLVFAPGFIEQPEKFDLAVLLTRIAFPYLLFMSLTAMLSGILNSLGRFAVAAAAPIALNVVLITVLAVIVLMGFDGSRLAGILMAWGVALAGLVQFVMGGLAARRAGFALGFRRPRLTGGVRALVRLGVPGVVAGGITQINIMIGTIIASMQASAVSWLYYADRVYQLPLGVIGIAVGIVLLPDLSRRLRAGDQAGADGSQNRALEFSMLLTMPATAAFMVLPHSIVQTLFERGAFAATDTAAAAIALAAFAAGLPAFVLIKVFSPGFFAREDTRTPMVFAGLAVAVNVAVSLALFFSIGHVGIAIATSLAGWTNALMLAVTLLRRGHFVFDARLKRRLPRIVLSSAIMALVLWLLAGQMDGLFRSGIPLAVRATLLGGLVVAGMAVFWAAAELTGAGHLREVLIRFGRPKRRE